MIADDASVMLVAAGGLDVEDLDVLARLAALVELADPIPKGLVDRVGMALTVEVLQAEMTHLGLSGAPLLALRSDEASIEADTITFTTDVLTVMISVRPDGDRVRIDGWAAPAGPLLVELHQGVDLTSAESDSDGRFVFAGLEHGPARLVMRRATDPEVPVVTPQIEL